MTVSVGEFRPVSDPASVVVAAAQAGTGDLAARLLALLRDHGGVLTFEEIRQSVPSELAPTRARLRRTLGALEQTGLVHRRVLITLGGEEPAWWAPRVPFAMPWNRDPAARGRP